MSFTIIDPTGPIISAKISGELTKGEVSQMQAAALAAIGRCGKISALFILEKFRWMGAHGLTMVEGVGGQLFLAVMVARLVSLYGRGDRSISS